MVLPKIIIVIFVLAFTGMIFYIRFLKRRTRGLMERLNDALHKKAEIGNFISLFSQNLKNLDEIDDSMNMTARYVADLVGAQSLCIFKLEDDYLRAEGISGAFPPMFNSQSYVLTKPRYILESLKRHKIKIGEGIIGEVAGSREPIFLENASDDPRTFETESIVPIETLMAVPMIYEGNVIGVICAVNNRIEKPFSSEQFSRLKFMASQVVLAHNIVQIYSTLSEQQRINQELLFARQLQASLLPQKFPAWDQFVVHSFTRSAKEVSGDFYDFVEIDQNRLLLVVGDASGKGVPACMIMAMTRSFIRSKIRGFSSLEDLLKELNENLFRDTEEESFITLGCCLLDKKNSTVEYVRAGHTSLIMFRKNHLRQIFPDGTALGLLPTELADFDTFKFEFTPDTSLLLYTDGITEAVNANQEEFGETRLKEQLLKACMNKIPPVQVTETILEAVDDFAGSVDYQTDDQTMVIIKHL